VFLRMNPEMLPTNTGKAKKYLVVIYEHIFSSLNVHIDVCFRKNFSVRKNLEINNYSVYKALGNIKMCQ